MHDCGSPDRVLNPCCPQALEEEARAASGPSRGIEQLVVGGAVFVREHHCSHGDDPQAIKRLSAWTQGLAPAEAQQDVPP